MKTLANTILLSALTATAACASVGPEPTLPRPGAGELRSSPSDARLAQVGPADCAGWSSWSDFEDRIQVDRKADGVCVTSRRPVVGKPRPNTGAMTIRMADGRSTRVAATDAAPAELFGYCRVGNQIRSVWIHAQTACLPADLSGDSDLLVRDADRPESIRLVSFR